MPNIIFQIGNYENEDAIENLVNYIMVSPYIEHYGWLGCFVRENGNIAEGICSSFLAVKNIYYDTENQQVQHIIIGFDDMEYMTKAQACIVAHAMTEYYFAKEYQVFWGIHFGSDHRESYRHIHIALNTINGMTGQRFGVTYDSMEKLKEYLTLNFPDMAWKCWVKKSFYQQNY